MRHIHFIEINRFTFIYLSSKNLQTVAYWTRLFKISSYSFNDDIHYVIQSYSSALVLKCHPKIGRLMIFRFDFINKIRQQTDCSLTRQVLFSISVMNNTTANFDVSRRDLSINDNSRQKTKNVILN